MAKFIALKIHNELKFFFSDGEKADGGSYSSLT
jgi:hypothetical protein